jgi:hypothetical protein
MYANSPNIEKRCLCSSEGFIDKLYCCFCSLLPLFLLVLFTYLPSYVILLMQGYAAFLCVLKKDRKNLKI